MGTKGKGFMKGFSKSLARSGAKAMDAEDQRQRDEALFLKKENLNRYTSELATDENIRKEGVAAGESKLERESRERIAGARSEQDRIELEAEENKEANKFASNYGYEPGSPEFAASVEFFKTGQLPADFPAEKDPGLWERLSGWGKSLLPGSDPATAVAAPTVGAPAATVTPSGSPEFLPPKEGVTATAPAAPAVPKSHANAMLQNMDNPKAVADFKKLYGEEAFNQLTAQ